VDVETCEVKITAMPGASSVPPILSETIDHPSMVNDLTVRRFVRGE
jgi:hypothetical protein